MSLSETLDSIRKSSHAKFGSDIVAIMKRATDELRASGIMQSACKAGDTAPSFSAPDQDGTIIHSADLLQRGPLVVSFYRGVW